MPERIVPAAWRNQKSTIQRRSPRRKPADVIANCRKRFADYDKQQS